MFLLEDRRYYVYAYFDDKETVPIFSIENKDYSIRPFYVGKGLGNRLIQHLRPCAHTKIKRPLYSKIYIMLKNSNVPFILKIKENLTEKEAYLLERKIIENVGIIFDNTGPLLNMNYGGEGGVSPSDIVRKKISIKNKGKFVGEKNGNYINGKKMKGENNPFFGKKHTEETKSKMKRKYYVLLPYEEDKIYLINDIEVFCEKNKLCSTNLIYSIKQKKAYKNIRICKTDMENPLEYLKQLPLNKNNGGTEYNDRGYSII